MIVAGDIFQDVLLGTPIVKLVVVDSSTRQLLDVSKRFVSPSMNEPKVGLRLQLLLSFLFTRPSIILVFVVVYEGLAFLLGYAKLLANGEFKNSSSGTQYSVMFPMPFPRREDMFLEMSMTR